MFNRTITYIQYIIKYLISQKALPRGKVRSITPVEGHKGHILSTRHHRRATAQSKIGVSLRFLLKTESAVVHTWCAKFQ